MSKENKLAIIQAINSPLGFFVLALLIVEGFLGMVLILSDLNSWQKFTGMLVGVGLFIMVVALVWYLVKNYPENLTFGEVSHLERRKIDKLPNWGNSENPEDKITIDNKESEKLTT